MVIAFLLLLAAVAAGAFFLYVSVLQIVIAVAVAICAISAAGVALAAGKLGRWIEVEETPPQKRGLNATQSISTSISA
jgi:hypothetical protein